MHIITYKSIFVHLINRQLATKPLPSFCQGGVLLLGVTFASEHLLGQLMQASGGQAATQTRKNNFRSDVAPVHAFPVPQTLDRVGRTDCLDTLELTGRCLRLMLIMLRFTTNVPKPSVIFAPDMKYCAT